MLSKIIVSWTSWSCIQALWRGSRRAFPDEVSAFSAPKHTRTWPRVECSGTLDIRVNISADLSEFLHSPRRKILPLLQSGAISYSLPGFPYAPPWANVYRHSVARIHCKAVIETFIPRCNSDRLLQNLFRTPVVLHRSLKTRNRLQTFGAFRHARLNQFSLWFCFSSVL